MRGMQFERRLWVSEPHLLLADPLTRTPLTVCVRAWCVRACVFKSPLTPSLEVVLISTTFFLLVLPLLADES